MRVYFDEEFTGLHQGTTLISLGMISDNNKKFYAEFTDYDKDQINEWLRDNVIRNLFLAHPIGNNRTKTLKNVVEEGKPSYDMTVVRGDSHMVKTVLTEWLKQFDEIELVSDVCHYDMVLFINIFGDAFDLPENIAPCCIDINQAIARFLGISQKEAFDINREEFAGMDDADALKHNSSHDADVIKACYEKIFNGGTFKGHTFQKISEPNISMTK